ncbi:hypothetical protein JHK82_046380 [Glycine max]|nr:hypothetical protein JHK86_046278 [Glycine max]KAG5096526.1 hypothetical protein JHK82_046380 [Glycine max]KAG5101317.1 hypothetical protein JHK84_046286 [Glycine max]
MQGVANCMKPKYWTWKFIVFLQSIDNMSIPPSSGVQHSPSSGVQHSPFAHPGTNT